MSTEELSKTVIKEKNKKRSKTAGNWSTTETNIGDWIKLKAAVSIFD